MASWIDFIKRLNIVYSNGRKLIGYQTINIMYPLKRFSQNTWYDSIVYKLMNEKVIMDSMIRFFQTAWLCLFKMWIINRLTNNQRYVFLELISSKCSILIIQTVNNCISISIMVSLIWFSQTAQYRLIK